MTLVLGGASRRFVLNTVVGAGLLLLLLWHKHDVADLEKQLLKLSFSPAFSPSVSTVHDSLYIWQIRFSPDAKTEERKAAWVELNPNATYAFLDKTAGDELVREYYAHRPDVQRVWSELGSPILKSDYLRYLALAARGGVYADLDAVPVKPVDEWILENFKGVAHAAIGLEFDRLNATDPNDHGSMEWNGMDHPVQFCQWTILAWAGHPIMTAMVDQVTRDLVALANHRNTTLQALEPDDSEVTRTTGPSAWTRLIFAQLSKVMHEEVSWRNVTQMTQPRLFGDVLILPINAFGSGQEHSGSSRGEAAPDALVTHLFEGFWKHG